MLGSPRHLALALALATTVAAGAAHAEANAQDVAQARALGQQAQEAFDKKDFAASERAWAAAARLYPVAPTLPLGLARAQAAGGKWVAAQETYNALLVKWGGDASLSPAFKSAVDAARAEREALQPRIPNVVITVSGAPAPKVTVDGIEVSSAALGFKRPVDPGTHAVKAEAEGHATVEQTFTAKEGVTAEVKLTFGAASGPAVVAAPPSGASSEPAPPPASSEPAAADGGAQQSAGSSRKTLAYVAFGVGAAGLVVGGVTGVMALGKKSDLDAACPAGRCPASAQGDVDSYSTLGTVSTIGFIAGGVGAAAGAVLWLTAPKASSSQAGVWPVLGPTGVGAVGRF